MDVSQNGRPLMGPQMEMSSLVLTIHNFGVPNFDPYPDDQRTLKEWRGPGSPNAFGVSWWLVSKPIELVKNVSNCIH